MAGWANGSVTQPHQLRETGSIPVPATMKKENESRSIHKKGKRITGF